MTPTRPSNSTLDPRVRAALAGLRRRIRLYVWLEGLAGGVAWLGTAFWVSLALDWFFEPAWPVRLLVLAVAVVGWGVVLYRLIGRRVLVALGNRSMATLLERRFPELGDSLLTSVELADCAPAPSGHGPAMLRQSARSAAERIAHVRPWAVFDFAPLRRSLMAAVAMVLSVGLFAAVVPSAMDTWARRSLLLGAELWPRKARIEVVGFTNGRAKVARGDDFEVRVHADMAMPWVPEVVQIRYRGEGGSRGRKPMNREGIARRGRDAFQEYSYTFQGVLAPIEFDLVGGDARIADLRIDVVESPTVESLALACQWPDYMDRKPRRTPVLGVTPIPLGTRARLEGRANKDLVRVEIRSILGQAADAVSKRITIPADAADRRRFECDLGPITADRTLLVTLFDTDGIRGRQPLRVVLGAVADEPPELPVQLVGIGTAITPAARLPIVGRATDDYGLARVWFEYTIDRNRPDQVEIVKLEGNPTELPLDAALEVRELAVPAEKKGVRPGQKLEIGLEAVDRRDLGEGPNTGRSQRWVLDVVTPERLRVMLQSRELVLRQQFEMIITEVTNTRDSLLQVEFQEAASPGKAAGVPPGGKPDKELGAEPGDEPGDAPAAGRAASPAEGVAVRLLHCQRAVDSCRKNAQETLGMAEAFDDIRLQLINNRIDTEELKIRLGAGIVEPLREIGQKRFAEWERRLVALREALGDPALGARRRDEARREADAILLAMNQVLARMTELEDFNEVIALLEEIIQSQKELAERTRQRQKSQLKDLLED